MKEPVHLSKSLSHVGFAVALREAKKPLMYVLHSSGVLASWEMHSASCAFSFAYDESYSEWSSFCSAVVHNSCKNMVSALSASKVCSEACVWKDLLRDKFCFSFIQLGAQTIFDQCSGKEPKAAFQFPALLLSLLFSLYFKKLSK